MSNRPRRRPPSYWLSMALLAMVPLLVLGFFWLGGFFAGGRQGPSEDVVRQVEALDRRMSLLRNIIMKGKDAQGRRYEIHAGGSRQNENNPDVSILEQVIGKIEQQQGPPLYFQARQALVHDKSSIVDLKDKAIIRKPGKWKLTGPHFRFDTKTHDLSSDKPVVAYLNNGEIRASGMQARDEGAVIRFLGPVHARFEETLDDQPATDARQQEAGAD